MLFHVIYPIIGSQSNKFERQVKSVVYRSRVKAQDGRHVGRCVENYPRRGGNAPGFVDREF